MYKLAQLLAHEVCVYERLCSMSTTVDLGKVIGPQGPQGAQGPMGPTGPKGDSYITKYVVNSSNKSVKLPQGVYAVQTSVSGREQIIVKFDGITSIQSLCAHASVSDVTYGGASIVQDHFYNADCIVLAQSHTVTASRAQGTSSVTFYKIA